MKTALGVLLIIAGIGLGLYVGVWVCLVGGVIQVIQSCQGSSVDAMGVALGIARVLCAGLAGVLSATIAILPGFAMVAAD